MHRKLEYAVFIIALLGLSFSGYLSAVKFFTKTCAFNESCPYFLGYPACYYGFVMYLVLAVCSGLHVVHLVRGERANQVVLVTSFLGILFAGYFTFGEITLLFERGVVTYLLGLPTCAYGLVFYVILFVLSMRLRKDFAAPIQ